MTFKPTGLLGLILCALACGSGLVGQSGLARMQDPMTGLPTDVLYNFTAPGVFTSVLPDGSLNILFPGHDTSPWLLREGPIAMDMAFGAGNWTAPLFRVVDAGYLLSDPGSRCTDLIHVGNSTDCGPWHPAETCPVPYLAGAHLHCSGFLGVFHSPCNAFGDDSLMVFDAPWHEGGRRNPIAWSYVRLQLL